MHVAMIKKISLIFLSIMVCGISIFANTGLKNTDKLKSIYGIYQDKFQRVPPPANFLTKSTEADLCDIQVSYNGFSADARKAFEYAVSIWESLLKSDQVIKVEAYWMEFDSDENTTVLGAAGASNFYLNKKDLPQNKVFYNAPLAEKLCRTDLNEPDEPDILAYFNSKVKWYYGTDGETPSGKFDLVSVILHELCHGLGFLGSMTIDKSNQGIWSYGSSYPYAFDEFVYNNLGQQLIDESLFPNPSKVLYNQLTGGKLYFDGPILRNRTGTKAQLYAPEEYDPGSSIDHLGQIFNNTDNSMMTPGIHTASSIHDPGEVVEAIMADLGWSTIFIQLDSIENIEEVQDIQVYADIEADFETEIINPTLHYAIDGGNWQTKDLAYNSLEQKYSSVINLSSDAVVKYYVSVEDKYGRVFNKPNTGQTEPDSVLIGADTIAPNLNHRPDNYFFSGNKDLILLCNVNDLYGIDTVYVEYAINGVEKKPLGLAHLEDDIYNIVLDVSLLNLKIDDTIQYRLVAIDKAKARNITYLPSTGYNELLVANMPEFIQSYDTDFEKGLNEFELDGFEFSKPQGFSGFSLNSKHPYKNGGEDTFIDFTAELVYPIKIEETYHFIQFDEIALIEPGEDGTVFNDDDFYDYVVVEACKVGSSTWIPLEDGWDCRLHNDWENAYNQSMNYNNFDILYSLDLYKHHLIDLTASGDFVPGDVVKIRFRLNSDPFEVGWGWSIDNLQIQTVGLSVPKSNLLSLRVYPNPVAVNEITIHGLQSEIKQLSLYNQMGNVVYKQKNVSGNKIHLPDHLQGMYILYIESGNKIYREKLLIN